MYKGIAASSGIAIAKAFLLTKEEIEINQQQIDSSQIEKEKDKFYQALTKARQQLEEIKNKAEQELGQEEAAIFGAHLMFLNDPMLVGEVENKISEEKLTAANALKQVIDSFVQLFSSMEDEYMKERVADIKDVGKRLLNNIFGIQFSSLADIQEKVIIIAEDLTPSDTAQMSKDYVVGFATEIGGRTSHTAIMARTLEIPAVVGLGTSISQINSGDLIIIDGNQGLVIPNPDQTTLKNYQIELEKLQSHKQKLKQLLKLPAQTTDGHQVELAANIGTPRDVDRVLENGGEGIGLYRTEFLYMDRNNLPSEEEQFQAYKMVAEKMRGKPVTIRTLDIGGDKKLSYLELPEEMNPFLGWRAIRICLEKTDIFKTQLRAILRASAYGKIRIMYPMISGLEEVRQANAILNEVKRDLDQENIDYNHEIEVGIMVEIPSAALTADIIAKEVDFFSIGTNDLCQYTIAVDRMNEKISYLYQPFHPAILHLIKNVIQAAHQEGKFVGICGEMAGEPSAALLLLGLGLDEFSMSASSIPYIKRIIRLVSLEQAKFIASQALQLATAKEIESLMINTLKGLEE